MDNFGFPSNIKQIGNIDDNMRIYIEDNVYSYLLKYAECNKNKESLAMLVGRCMFVEGEQVLFINGAIEGKYTYIKKGLMAFSEQSLQYVEEQKDTYFKGLEIVGWVISQPCFGNFLSGGYAKYHTDNFKKKYQVLFVTDPVEKVHSFFSYDINSNDIVESGGFFIYYDKNKDMENYVADNEIKEFNIQEVAKEKVDTDDEYDENTNIEDIKVINNKDKSKPKSFAENGIVKIFKINENGEKEEIEKCNTIENCEDDLKQEIPEQIENKKVVRQPKSKPKAVVERKKNSDNAHLSKKKLQEKALERERKRTTNMYTAVSFLLAVLSFALGSSLIENSRKLDRINQDLHIVKTSYNKLTEYLDNQDTITVVNNDNFQQESVQASGTTMILKDFDEEETVTDTNLSSANSYINNYNGSSNSNNYNKKENNDSNNEISKDSTNFIPETYVVESGDSLLNIANVFYGDSSKVNDIMELNELDNADKIYIGMVLRLPQ